jgi:apolipoprotein D and lipocalin family protein
MKRFALPLLVTFFSTQGAMAMGSKEGKLPEPEVVSHVDVPRYMGLWYEVARFDQKFQKGCVGVTAEYSLLDNGKVAVLNTCFAETLDGERRQAEGKARIADPVTNAKLRVTFFWPFYGDYWIFRLGDNYEYAVVGSPDRDSLWFLSREPHMEETLFKRLYAEMASEGFDMKRLQPTPQR